MVEQLMADLDQDIAELVSIYPELAGVAPGYVPTADDRWSVRMLHAMRIELDELESLLECDSCSRHVGELYTRTDGRDNTEMRVCDSCTRLEHMRCDDEIDL